MLETAPANSSNKSLETALLLEKYEPIAIVGIGMRVPGDNNTPAEFAEFLKRGGSGIAPIPSDRWDVDAIYSSELGAKGKNRQSSGGYLSNIDRFDAKFFGISPKEANVVDPQHRLLLECAWIALESANIDPTSLRNGDGGVYIGMGSYDWALALEAVELSRLETDMATGTSPSAACGRLSHFLGWRGPSVTFDTACSSSLTALHFAVQGLRRRECGIALCGGVNLIGHPRSHVVFSLSNMLATDGRCKTFDDSADGYGRSEGCIIFVLKRLSDARRDGDSILALVRGSSVGQDGESGGLTVPNGDAQVALMTRALASALLRPEDIQYVEAHGTGTPLGDPIEMGSIHNVFSATHNASSPIIVGSVKTNIGHLEPAAGAAGLLKVILQMQEGKIFPHINVAKLSRYIPWDQYCVSVPTQLRDWPAGRRRALVNSFGFAGTLASVVVEEAPPPATAPSAAPDAGKPIFTVSAKSPASLRLQLNQYQDLLRRRPELAIAELCNATNVARAHFARRFARVVSSGTELLTAIEKKLSKIDVESKREVQDGKIAFLFTGSGSQYIGMGRALYAQFATVRHFVDQCDKLFQPLVGCSIKALCFDASSDHEKKIHQTQYTQPALFTLEYAIARLWMSWGIAPTVVLGHSTGEIAAAAVAGLFTLEDAVKLVAARGKLMQSAPPGGMVAVRAAHEDIAPLLRTYADAGIAAINTPEQCVIAGGTASLGLICQALQERGVETTELPISVAAHSPLMNAVVPAFREVLDQVVFSDPRISVVSNVTGRVANAAEVGNPEYWVNHLVKPVNFAAGMQHVQARGRHIFLEVGPSSTLLDMGRMFAADTTHVWLPSLSPKELDSTDTIRKSLAQAYVEGAAVSWSAYHADRHPCRKVAIPTYAFDRRSYGLDVPSAPALKSHSPAMATAASGPHPLLGAESSTAEQRLAGVREFRTLLDNETPPYLADHTIAGFSAMPVAGFVEAIWALQDAIFGETSRIVHKIHFDKPLFLSETAKSQLAVRAWTETDGTARVEVASRPSSQEFGNEQVHVTATVGPVPSVPQALSDTTEALVSLAARAEAVTTYAADEVYAKYRSFGMQYGPAFRCLTRLTRHVGDLAVSDIRYVEAAPCGQFPVQSLESAFQSIIGTTDLDDLYLPFEIESVVLFKKPRGHLRCVVRVTSPIPKDAPPPTISADIVVFEGTRAVLAMTDVTFARITPVALKRLLPNYEQQQINVDRDALRKLSTRDRKASITTTLRMIVAQVLRFEGPDDVEVDTKFTDMGLYSLAAIEFRNALEAAFHIAIAVTAMIDYPKVSVLADFIDRELAGDSNEASARPVGRQLADMSDAEADAELAALRDLT